MRCSRELLGCPTLLSEKKRRSDVVVPELLSPVRMLVAPSPVFGLALALQTVVVAILAFTPFFHQPMAIGALFIRVPHVIVVAFPVVVTPVVIFRLNGQRCNQRRTQTK